MLEGSTARPIDVSVIVPTRDSVHDLRRCLASVESQEGGISVQVIVVDQASSDGTAELAEAASATLIETSRPTVYTPPTRSRNLGAAAADGAYLLHLDADMVLEPHTLVRAIEECSAHGHVAIVLEEIDVAEGFWSSSKALERFAYRGTAVEAARFVRADVFRGSGGYDERLGSGEDWDVHARYVSFGSIGRLETAILHFLGSLTFRGQVRKKYEYGRSASGYMRRHNSPAVARDMLIAYLRAWRRFAARPNHSLGFVTLRLAETAALATGIAAQAVAELRQRPSALR
jgi:glycosyltransferase involved in cell wall biosynthesis